MTKKKIKEIVWYSPSKEEIEQCAKRCLEAAFDALGDDFNKDRKENTLARNTHLILKAFKAAHTQHKADENAIKQAHNKLNENAHSIYLTIPHIIASALYAKLLKEDIEDVDPECLGAFPIYAFAEACGLLKQFENFNSYVDAINDDMEFYSNKIGNVIKLVDERLDGK